MPQNQGGYDNTNRGAIFKNKKKEAGDSRPDLTGSIDVDGQKYFLSAWFKVSKANEKFMSLAVTKADAPAGRPAPARQAPKPQDGFTQDDIPF